jgi:hypothetical protein
MTLADSQLYPLNFLTFNTASVPCPSVVYHLSLSVSLTLGFLAHLTKDQVSIAVCHLNFFAF